MNETIAENLTKDEKARILGARALQIAMNAPLLIRITPEDLEKVKYDSLKIAEIELNSNILPITINKPFPKKKEDVLKRVKEQKAVNKHVEDKEAEEEEEIVKSGEIMELVNPDDETEGEYSGGTEEDFGGE